MKSNFKKLSHTLYECKYHLVFCPKYRHRILKGEIAYYCHREFCNQIRQKDLVEVLELNVRIDHVHKILSLPPKYSVSSIMGFVKGRISIAMFHRYERLGKHVPQSVPQSTLPFPYQLYEWYHY